MNTTGPLMCFYGDDFTGSTDALESLWLAGLSTTLFTQAPTRRRLAEHPGLQAFGVAGMSRAMSPDRMDTELRPVLASLRDTGVPIVHYKICSTFDSSPTVGSIGKVIEIGLGVFGDAPIPIVAGAPSLGRYCLFGNLFARLGADGPVYRLDRHPSMSKHPITPMDEADLRLHLAKQTDAAIGLVTSPQLACDADAALAANIDDGAKVILIDLDHEEQLPTVGRLIERGATGESPRFVIGSSGVGSAMAAYWHDSGLISALSPRSIKKAGRSKSPILVISGSCSPVSAAQIKHAAASGFVDLRVDVNALLDSADAVHARLDLVRKTIAAIETGKSVVIHTGSSKAKPSRGGSADLGAAIGLQLGRVIRAILNAAPIRRVVVAGGDTSGAIAVALDIESLDMIGTLVRGAPLCRVSAVGSPAHGLEIVFKGGQVGPEHFFSQALSGVA